MSNNSYGYHEITDRCSIVISMIEDFILDHHLCTEEWKKLAEEAQDLIVKIYRQSSILGEMSDRDRQIQRDDSDLLPDNNEEVVRELLDEIDRRTTKLAEVMEEAKVWQDRYRKRGYVMDEHAKALERAEVAEAELARYKQGVEVDGLVAYENYPWPIRILDTALEKFHHECVRVLVMKVEE